MTRKAFALTWTQPASVTPVLRLARLIPAPVTALAVAGCASTVAAQVTTFQQWPADAVGSSWRFESSHRHADSLEYSNYADQIRAAIGATGLVEAQSGEPARFRISFDAQAERVH